MLTKNFGGFQSGSRATVIPNTFFSLLLPQIAEPQELLVTVYAFFVLGRKAGNLRSISVQGLADEIPLMQSLARLTGGAEVALKQGLSAAVARGTLLVVGRSDAGAALYAINTDVARRVAADSGLLANGDAHDTPDSIEPSARTTQPNIYALYEENIGSVPPLLLDELEEAEAKFPQPWIEAAFKEAVSNNRRSWRYISRILERWKLEGPDYEATGGPAPANAAGHRRTIGGPYRRIVDRRV